jgi:hypothetical protein
MIPPDVKQCPVCGAMSDDIEPCDAESPASDDMVHSLLLSTNLLKLRGELDAAIEECIKALRINPDCVEAHSLLGDIYRAQGKVQDAIRWYTLALDLRPDSEIDRARLNELLRSGEKQRALDRAKNLKIPQWLTSRRIIWGLLTVIMGLLAMVISPMLLETRGTNEPGVLPDTRVHGLSSMRRHVTHTQAPAPVLPIASERENVLMSAVNESVTLSSRGIRVVSVTIDPRNQSACINFIGPSLSGADGRTLLAQNALIVMREATVHDASVTDLTVRALYSLPTDTGGVRTEVVLIADATRNSVIASTPAFQSIWWNPQIKFDEQ